MPTTIDFPIGQPPDFPPRCIRCGRESTSNWKCERTQGIDLLLFALWKSYACEVPVCGRCKLRREILGILAGVLLIAVLIGLCFGAASVLIDAGLDNRIPFLVGLAAILGGIWYLRNRHTGLADRFLLGVQLTQFNSPHNVATMWFNDEHKAPRFDASAFDEYSESPLQNVGDVVPNDSNPYRAPAEAAFEPVVYAPRPAVKLTRIHAALLMAGGALMLLINHVNFESDGSFYPGLVFAGPPCIVLGAMGLWKPQLIRAFETRRLPWWMRAAWVAAIAVGLAGSAYLLRTVYH